MVPRSKAKFKEPKAGNGSPTGSKLNFERAREGLCQRTRANPRVAHHPVWSAKGSSRACHPVFLSVTHTPDARRPRPARSARAQSRAPGSPRRSREVEGRQPTEAAGLRPDFSVTFKCAARGIASRGARADAGPPQGKHKKAVLPGKNTRGTIKTLSTHLQIKHRGPEGGSRPRPV